ncbi:MAG: beta-glucosidase [Chlorobi bacterium]|nr:beta-glucosidase [Chlorobiota bacterium]
MTLKEKTELVVGTGMHFEVPDSVLPMIPEQVRRMFNRPVEWGDSVYKAMVKRISRLVPGAAGHTAAFDRLGITTTVLTDGPAGLRIQPQRPGDSATYYCTAFPIATLLASSWDIGLVENVGKAMGNEVLEYGSDVLLAPALNIQRNPLCGRNFEYYSEDPLIAGKMAAAMVRGIQSQGVGTSIKHFDANNQETHRMSVNTIVSQRALREIYLKGFRIAVQEGHPWTVMSSYNKINGTYASESHDLLTKILRDDWGFNGYVMTDWGAGTDPVAQMKAGNDLLMPGTPLQIEAVMNAVKNGILDSTFLDTNVERILNIILRSPRFNGYACSNRPDLKAHAAVARRAAAGGMILLKNDADVLPITGEGVKVALFGNSSYETIIGGTGSGDVNEAYSISIVDGLSSAGMNVSASLQETYLNYIKETRKKIGPSKNWLANIMGAKMPVPEMTVNRKMASQATGSADVALITIGRNAGEGADREIEGDFILSKTEQNLIKNVTSAFHDAGKKVVVVLNIDGVIETVSWRELPDAILLAWQPGQEAGNAIADVLTGKVNPSGKLAITFPVKYEDEPSAPNFPGVTLEGTETGTEETGASFMRRVPAEVVYKEDIFVGYRYFSTFDVPVAYPFGYGLSYTTFDYSSLKPGGDYFEGSSYTVSVDITNSGNIPGKEVVQLYLHAPAKTLTKPEEELRAFAKTVLLKPGESETVSFTLTPEDLASFDESRSAWVAEKGTYEVRIGASSRDIKFTTTFDVNDERVVREVSNALAPHREFKRLQE